MLTAIIGLLGVAIGVLVGGAMQLFVAWRERKLESRRAARLLFGDCHLAIEALQLVQLVRIWWNDQSAPPLDGWRRYREALAGAMEGNAFQTIDGAFYRVAKIETFRLAKFDLTDIELDAEEAIEQLQEAQGLLLLEGFRGAELARAQQTFDADVGAQEHDRSDN